MMEDGNTFRQYLDVQGHFDRYSVNNAILVAAQMPEATQLKDYSSWKQNRIYVDKDAQKITILEPGKEYRRDDGTTAVGYNAKVVYDISQTSAKDRQQTQEQKSMRELVAAMIDASPVSFVPVPDLGLPAFYDKGQQIIFIRTGLSEEQLFLSMSTLGNSQPLKSLRFQSSLIFLHLHFSGGLTFFIFLSKNFQIPIDKSASLCGRVIHCQKMQ